MIDVKTLAFMLTQIPQDAEIRIRNRNDPGLGNYLLELPKGFYYDHSTNILYLG